ncbi:PREDICTED: DENN domain-containing protein 1A-like [Priapulus caudatus]|uniref:DENN domain-containing protein 1A-like n=1 Tax=Priapulus caudatus TaxID=37621 RepID=A0ABM1ELU6_PRICU|nr:PREDICTED: DENN domain-containing protein 1A-like [Priapulus caudatus]XP_014673166.1 PREDICTED: DENN domain-containing protein 1A-like [Priapulus caudatus]XP_014673167.1 PREDICTED: DENN domain-containing protein 1A-like [Priapulus caudatus]XP_014673168.1 PREDICTED: DENN domain-containing protein 1A-like [Priapulus caudatus]
MGSRIRQNPSKVFEVFTEIAAGTDTEEPWILQKYPADFDEKDVLKSLPRFAFPCKIDSNAVQLFSFVVTNVDSKFAFGFCRHAPNSQTCLCLLSYLPWFDVFFKLLNAIADAINSRQDGALQPFLDSVYQHEVPSPGNLLEAQSLSRGFSCICPDTNTLPSIPESRNLMEYFNAVDPVNMICIFASMLNERRVVFTSKKLGRLTSCVFGAASLLYPMHWQHIFIPVLPMHLKDYLTAPMPFIIGVPTLVMEKALKTELGDAFVLDLDTNQLESHFDDVENMPGEVVSSLKRRLKDPNNSFGDGLARSFLHAMVLLIGGYRDALRFRPGEVISFDEDLFLQSRPAYLQPFLENMLQLQIFQQFIDERLEMLNSGEGFSDEFEYENNLYGDKVFNSKLKNQYRDWMVNMKKGGALLRIVKDKVKDKGKKTYKDIRTKWHDIQSPKLDGGDLTVCHKLDAGACRSSSAPSSPTSSRKTLDQKDKRVSRNLAFGSPHPVLLSGKKEELLKSFERSRRYNVLNVDNDADADEAAWPRGGDDDDDSPDYKRVSMNLLQEMHSIIYPDTAAADDGEKEDEDEEETQTDDASGAATHARSKRSPIMQLTRREERELSVSWTEPAAGAPPLRKSHSDVPLIRLDSLEEATAVAAFDPLLGGERAPLAAAAAAALPATYPFASSYTAGTLVWPPGGASRPAAEQNYDAATPQVRASPQRQSIEGAGLPPPASPRVVAADSSLIDLGATETCMDMFDPLGGAANASTDARDAVSPAAFSAPPSGGAASPAPFRSPVSGQQAPPGGALHTNALFHSPVLGQQAPPGGSPHRAASFHSSVSGQQARTSGLFKILQTQPVSSHNAFAGSRPSAVAVADATTPTVVRGQPKPQDPVKPAWEKFD